MVNLSPNHSCSRGDKCVTHVPRFIVSVRGRAELIRATLSCVRQLSVSFSASQCYSICLRFLKIWRTEKKNVYKMMGSTLINNHRQRKIWVMLFFLTVAKFSLKHDTQWWWKPMSDLGYTPRKIGRRCEARFLKLSPWVFPFSLPYQFRPLPIRSLFSDQTLNQSFILDCNR